MKMIPPKRNPPNFTCAKALPKERAWGKVKTRERRASLSKVALETPTTDMLLHNLALKAPKVRGKEKANHPSKERENLLNMGIEEREQLALLLLVLQVPRPTHPSHVDSAIKMGIPLTVVEED